MTDPVLPALTGVFATVLPEAVLGLFACGLFLGGRFRANRHLWVATALVGLGVAGLALWRTQLPGTPADAAFAAPLFADELALFVRLVALAGGAVLLLLSWNEVPDAQAADYHACLLLALAGLGLTASANELVTLFLSLELISIPTYVLLYLPRHDEAAQEAAMKYFLLSVFSSALLLFGFSYLYGLAGTTNIPALIDALTNAQEDGARLPAVSVVALVTVVAGLSFRITAVPFHHYAPDVYQGAPTPLAALLAFLPKAAGLVALIRLLGFVWAGTVGNGLALGGQVPILLWILAAVTMTLGNILALLQSNLKRLLAYSSVAHAGYMLIGLSVAFQFSGPGQEPWVPGGVEAVLFYLVAYAAMTVGAFAVLSCLGAPGRPVETEDDLAGLGRSHPGLAFVMAVFLFSLIGIPLTAGFAGKLFLFLGAMAVKGDRAVWFHWLALVGVLNSAVGAWYYLRILARMYLHGPIKPLPRVRTRAGLAAVGLCAILTVAFGVPPGVGLLRHAAGRAALSSSDRAPAEPQSQPGRLGSKKTGERGA